MIRDKVLFSISFLCIFISAVFFLSSEGVTGRMLAVPSSPMISYSSLSIGMAVLYLLGRSLKKKSKVSDITYMELYKNAFMKRKETEDLLEKLPSSKSFRGICEIFLAGLMENNLAKMRVPAEFQEFLTKRLRKEKSIVEMEKISRILYNSYAIALKSENVPEESVEAIRILYNQCKHFTLSLFKNRD